MKVLFSNCSTYFKSINTILLTNFQWGIFVTEFQSNWANILSIEILCDAIGSANPLRFYMYDISLKTINSLIYSRGAWVMGILHFIHIAAAYKCCMLNVSSGWKRFQVMTKKDTQMVDFWDRWFHQFTLKPNSAMNKSVNSCHSIFS